MRAWLRDWRRTPVVKVAVARHRAAFVGKH